MLQVNHERKLLLDGEDCALRVLQGSDGTLVYSPETDDHFWCAHQLPCLRYETYPCPPSDGWESVEVFEEHVRAYLPKVAAVLARNDKRVIETSGAAQKPALAPGQPEGASPATPSINNLPKAVPRLRAAAA